jgi:hypothetical protein
VIDNFVTNAVRYLESIQTPEGGWYALLINFNFCLFWFSKIFRACNLTGSNISTGMETGEFASLMVHGLHLEA